MSTDDAGAPIAIAFIVGLASWVVAYAVLELGGPWVYAIPCVLALLTLIYGAWRACE
jgi:hypothetical protein